MNIRSGAQTTRAQSSSNINLFDYDKMARLSTPYPKSRFKLSHSHLDQIMKKQLPNMEIFDDLEEKIKLNEEEVPKVPENERPKTGGQAMFDFYNRFKNITNNTAKSQLSKSTASFKYLSAIDKFNAMPIPMGIVKWGGTPTDINLGSFKMGDSYATALGKSLKHINPEKLNISDNRLTRKGSESIITRLRSDIKTLDISKNQISHKGALLLGRFVRQKALTMFELNVENTRLGDSGVINLCISLRDHPKLKQINFSRNGITDKSSKELAQLVNDSFYLCILSLHWNQLSGEGAAKIVKATSRHLNIKVLDLSWNNIGTVKPKMLIDQFTEALTVQENFKHVDIGNNKIKNADMKRIATALSGNKTLWGLHTIGNEGYIDSKGFLHPGPKPNAVSGFGADNLSKRINAMKVVVFNSEIQEASLKRVSCCWVCEGWEEVFFRFPFESNKMEPVYLCLECDNFAPELMQASVYEKIHTLYRMCPPGKCRFFFIYEGQDHLLSHYGIEKYSLDQLINLDDEWYPQVQIHLSKINYHIIYYFDQFFILGEKNYYLINNNIDNILNNCLHSKYNLSYI